MIRRTPCVLVLLVVGAVAGQDKKADPPKATEAKLEEIGAAFQANEIKAEKAWKGKRVRVRVVPTAVVKGKDGNPVVGARCGFNPEEGQTDAAFGFDKSAADDVAAIERGKPVTIEATVVGVEQ